MGTFGFLVTPSKQRKTPLAYPVDPLLPVAGIIHTKKWFVIHSWFTGGERGTLVMTLYY